MQAEKESSASEAEGLVGGNRLRLRSWAPISKSDDRRPEELRLGEARDASN